MKIAFISAGHIHMKDFVFITKQRPQFTYGGVYDANPQLAAKWAKELNTTVVTDYRQILEDPSIEAVVIAGTTAEHDLYVEPTALAGKKLYIEKPLAVNSIQASKFYQVIKKTGVLFQTGHFMRSDARYRFLKQEIAAGNFGTITRVRAYNCHEGAVDNWFATDYRWLTERPAAGGGGFMDLGCHSVDLLVFLFGPIASITASLGGQTIRYPNIDEYGEALLKFQSGLSGSVAAGCVSRRCPVKLEIDGTEGYARVQDDKLYYFSKKTTTPNADGNTPIDAKDMPEALPRAYNLFLDVLEGKAEVQNLIPIEDALHVAKVMESAYLSDKVGSWVKV